MSAQSFQSAATGRSGGSFQSAASRLTQMTSTSAASGLSQSHSAKEFPRAFVPEVGSDDATSDELRSEEGRLGDS